MLFAISSSLLISREKIRTSSLFLAILSAICSASVVFPSPLIAPIITKFFLNSPPFKALSSLSIPVFVGVLSSASAIVSLKASK